MIKFLRRDEGPSDPADQNAAPAPGNPASETPRAAPFGPRRDDGLGVPPFKPALTPASEAQPKQPDSQGAGPAAPPLAFRPQQDKETFMARSPFTSSQASGVSGTTPAPASPMPGGAFRPNIPRAPEAAERRTLVVGRGISLQGVVQDAERLVVEGTVEATMIHAAELAITQGGIFKGEVEVEEAEIAGLIDGTLTARHALIVRGTGRVLGIARCKRLQVEDGGQITGRIEMLSESDGASD